MARSSGESLVRVSLDQNLRDSFNFPYIVIESFSFQRFFVEHSAILTDDGKVWCFGAGVFGALGQGHNFTDQWWPTQVTALKDEFVIDLKCGQHHTVALTDKGEVWTWGMSRHGQCGRPRDEAFMLTKYEELGEVNLFFFQRIPHTLRELYLP